MVRPAATRVASFAAAAAASLSLMAVPPAADAHPLCYYGPDRAVSFTAEATFCPDEDPEGFCCLPDEEDAVAARFASAGTLSEECAPLYKEVLCGVCSPYSAHLYTRMMDEDGLAMKYEFCDSFVTACGAELGLDTEFCEEHVLDNRPDAPAEYWSYPMDVVDTSGDADVPPAFPGLPEESLPLEPIAMQMTPDGTAWWIAGMAGQIKMAAAEDPTDAVDVLDLSGKIEYSFEQGVMGFAFSPSFTDTGLFYVSYVLPGESNPENGINVLSKFVYVAGDTDGTYESEEVLITTTEKASSVHSSGWVGFAPSSYAAAAAGASHHDLYWSVGDGGPQNDPMNRAQDLSEYHGSIVRISVPSDVSASGYELSAGNPFDGAGAELGEICAWGLRNPHRCAFDRSNDALYCGDVGQDRVEEVNLIECGKDYGWRMFEGTRCNDGYEDYPGDDCEELDRADYTFPVFQYCHFDYDSEYECGDRSVTGLAVMGGYVYRGSKLADVLDGHYIFADHSTGSLHHLTPATGGGWTAGTILSASPKIVGFAEDQEGELYMIGYQGNIYELPCGDLCGSAGAGGVDACMPQSHDVPTYEEIGCFNDGNPKAMGLATSPACDGTMSAEICASFCATVEGATHFGLEYQRECHCGGADDDYTHYGDELAPGDCDMPCSGAPGEMCGGDGTMNVYAITGVEAPPAETEPVNGTSSSAPEPVDGTSSSAPESETPVAESSFPDNYVGCYGDDARARALTLATTESETMTTEECESFCSEKGASIYATEYGHQCFCGTDESDFEIHGPSDGCNLPCVGDPSTYCGGYDAMSVYTMVGSASAGGVAVSSTSSSGSGSLVMSSFTASAITSASAYASTEGNGSSFYDDLTSADGAHEHKGCYVDFKSGRMLRGGSTASSNMTPSRCNAFCSEGGHEVFNLQYGNECWCGDLDSLAAAIKADDDSLCDYACEGDPSHRCGGYLYADVYTIN
eukprot:g7527.t1